MCIASWVHPLVSFPGMGRVKFRTLEDLYHRTDQVFLPTQPFKFEIEEKSRTCNLCAIWCSSCMHIERVAAIVSVGIDNFTDKTDDFTDKTSEEKRTSHCSSDDSILFCPSLSSACHSRQHTSSEASNIVSVSSSHDSFSENAEIQATFRDSDSCKDIELLLNITAREFGDTPKGLINFDNQRFSNQLERHKELEILGDNISFISRSENGGADRKNVSYCSVSDNSFPVVEKDVNERVVYLSVAGTQFDETTRNHCEVQNFIEEPSLAEVVIPNRSDQSDISSLKDLYDCAISAKGEPSECSSEQVESSLAKAAISALGSFIDGVYDHATFVGVDLHLNCFETESHSYCKKHLQKSVDVIKNTSMQESWQSQPAEPRGVSDLMDDEARVCDICGDAGREDSLAICSKCTDGAEHIYCMRFKLDKVPEGDWMCEECMLRSEKEKLVQGEVEEAARTPKGHIESQKSESSVNLEFRSSSRLKLRSSYVWKSGTKGASSKSHLSAKRHGVPLESQSVKKGRLIGTSAVPPRSSKPCNKNSLLQRKFSCKNLKKGEVKTAKDNSVLQISWNSQEKAKVYCAWGEKRHAGTLEAVLDKKRQALETVKGASIQKVGEGETSKKSLLSRETPFKILGKAKLEPARSVSSMKRSSYGTQEKAKLPSRADLKFKEQLAKGGCLQKQKDERNLAFHDNRKGKDLRMVSKSVSFNCVSSEKPDATCSEVLLANAYCPVVLKNSSSAEETKTTKGKDASKLHNPAMCLLTSDSGVTAVKSEKKTISSDENIFSETKCCQLHGCQSCGQLDNTLQPSSPKAHEDQSFPNEEKKNERWQAHCPTEASMKLHKVCTSLASEETSRLEAAFLSEGFIIPKPDYIWLGKFQTHSSEKIASTYDGIQAHLSTCASHEVIEVVDRLPEIIILKELPRLRIWPSQFMGSQATEENIAIYFFAKDLDSYRTYYKRLMEYMTENDLALKGNLDGVELLIFPSNVLPEKSQCWNKLLFFWGVFRGQKIINSANTQVSNSEKIENTDIVRSCILDLNAYPQDGNGMVRIDEISKFDSIGTKSSGDRILLGGDSYDPGCSYLKQAPAKVGMEKSQSADIDLNLSLLPESEKPEDGPCLSVATADNETNEDMHGKLLMDEENNADNAEPSRPPCRLLALPTIYYATSEDGPCQSAGTEDDKTEGEVHDKLLMDEADNVEPSSPPSLSLASLYEENMDPLERQAVDTLMILSKGIRKF